MTDNLHDRIANFIARTRFPFAGQTTWPADYVTLTNVPRRQRAIASAKGEHFPDIVILDGTGRVREIGEVEMTLSGDVVMHLRAGSDSADADTPSGVRHFFLYVPSGMEQAAERLLDENAISYAGVRGFTVGPDGKVTIVPYVTTGDPYDHQVTG